MTMLIVEDQDLMRRMLREFLQSAYADSRILETDIAERALALCDSHRPRVVPMDVKLPDGNGIEVTVRLFGPPQRLHRAEEYEGTGLGIPMIQRVTRRHGGRVWAEATPGKGANSYFTLAMLT